MGADVVAQRASVLFELLLRQRARAAYQFAVHARTFAALARAVLHGLDLHVVPVFPERADDAAVMGHVAVPVGGALPHAHGGEVRRLEARHMPLIDGVIGDTVEPDLAVRPRLRAGPFDAVVEVLGLAGREMIDETGRAPASAGIDAHAGIVVRHPFLRIDNFPALVEVARSGGDVGVLLDHALPGARIPVLEGEALGIGAVAQDYRVAAALDRTKDVGAQHHAIIHLDRDIPVDVHAVAYLAAVLVRAGARARVCSTELICVLPPDLVAGHREFRRARDIVW